MRPSHGVWNWVEGLGHVEVAVLQALTLDSGRRLRLAAAWKDFQNHKVI